MLSKTFFSILARCEDMDGSLDLRVILDAASDMALKGVLSL